MGTGDRGRTWTNEVGFVDEWGRETGEVVGKSEVGLVGGVSAFVK